MTHNWKTRIAILLSVVLLITFFVGCSNNRENPEQQSGNGTQNTVDVNGNSDGYGNSSKKSVELKGLTKGRIEKAIALDDFFVEKAKSKYKIVYSDSAPEIVLLAVSEFNYFLEKSTGLKLDTISDKGLTFDNNSQYVSIGDTTISKQASVSYDMGQYDGFVVKTVNKSVFIDGDNYGVLYGVYKALYYLVDYEYFSPDVYTISKNLSEIRLYNFDIAQFPDFRIRKAGWGSVNSSMEVSNRLMMTTEPISLAVVKNGHNSMDYIPLETYFNPEDQENYHPKWYMDSAKPTQLCYTAHGDEAELEAMINACFDRLKVELIGNPVGTIANFSLSDDANWCDCDACTASKNKYGTTVGAVIQFLNRFIEKAYAWFETDEGKPYKRDLKVLFYAYYSLEVPPVVYDESTGKYKPVDESVVCNPNVLPQLCLTNANYVQPVSTGSMNGAARKAINGWSVCADNICAYMYNSNYRHYLVPHNTFSALVDWYKSYEQVGTMSMYNHGQGNEYGLSTGWSNLKIYIDSKLQWDVNADYQGLIDRFFKGVYADGADDMRKIFDEFRVITQYHATVNSKEFLTTDINGNNITKAKFWPLNKLNEWRALVSSALEKIEHLKTEDPEVYSMAYKYTICERVWIDHLLYRIYSGTMSSKELSELKDEHYDDIVYCGIKREWQGASTENYLKELKA